MTTARDVAAAGWLLDPAGFGAHLTQGHYQIPRWVDYVSRIIARDFARGGARLLVSTPPQFGKSLLCSGLTPPWCVERDPSSKNIVASYAVELAARSVRYGRDLVRENESRLRIRMGKSSEEYWESIPGGGRTPGYVRAVGVGSGTTGFGIDNGILDDPYSGPDQAFSEAYRAKVEEWFWSVFMTRLSKNANVLGIMTRWHARDLFAKLIDGGGWTEIRLPALAEEDDPLGRAPGESLWPGRHPVANLIRLRDGPHGDGRGAMPPRIWQALYQGRPIGESGGVFQLPWFHYVDAVPQLVSKRVRYWDPAASKRQKAGDPDYAVGTLASRIRTGPLDGAYCIEEIDRGRGSALEVERRILAAAMRDGRAVPIRIEQEPGSESVLYIAYLQRLLAGHDVQGVQHGTDKLTRAKPFAAQMEVGNVVWVRGAWNAQAREELLAFVGDGSEDHDDVPDSVTGAFEELAGAARWPWESSVARRPADRGGDVDREIGFDRGEFERLLDSCAPGSALEPGGGAW